MVKEFPVKVILRDKEFEVLHKHYEYTNELFVAHEMKPYASFEEYLGMVADAACANRVREILDGEF